jgi:hypothetical protein
MPAIPLSFLVRAFNANGGEMPATGQDFLRIPDAAARLMLQRSRKAVAEICSRLASLVPT